MGKLIVAAIGGNALVKDKESESVHDQFEAVCSIASHIADMAEDGIDIVITHGNGPQVGYALRRSEIAHHEKGVTEVPLVNCVADTQGGIGYMIQQALTNEFLRRKMDKKVATVITQAEVNATDANFFRPTKPVGSFMSKGEAEQLMSEHPEWTMIEDSGRGYRRTVPSPLPIDIIEKEAITAMVRAGFIVIAAGGGGIPVIKKADGTYEGVDAVIDKDFSTSLLAQQLKADALVITTGVPKVCIHYGKPEQEELSKVTMEAVEAYKLEHQFPEGSMLPKVEASLQFLKNGGSHVVITNPENLGLALKGKAGTHIIKNI